MGTEISHSFGHFTGEYVPQPPLAESMSSLRVEPLITVPKCEGNVLFFFSN